MTAGILAARELSFAYHPGRPVLEGVNLEAHPGRCTALLGPNGSGKTTLLRCLLGRLIPQGGDVLLEGRPVGELSAREAARRMAYVPQLPEAAFDFPVRELVLMGRYAHTGPLGLTGPRDRAAAAEALDRTGTTELAHRFLTELSGGEAQRVMIARALAQEPAVLLLDEPTSHLDLGHRLRIHRLLVELAQERNLAVVSVGHDLSLAARFADELVLLREGRVVAAGTPAEVLRPELLAETYGVRVRLIDDPEGGTPLIRGD